MISAEHLAMNREARLSAGLIANGATLLGNAAYWQQALYPQAFFALSIGFERAAKLAYMADCAIEHGGIFPSNATLKRELGHNLTTLFEYIDRIANRRASKYSSRPSTDIHSAIISVLSDFAKTSRYYNLAFVTGDGSALVGDPIAQWNSRVIAPILGKHLSSQRREQIESMAVIDAAMLQQFTSVLQTHETGAPIRSV